jgi:hypothetical protein
MKITIDLKDFWLDSDSNLLETELKKYITRSVRDEIFASIKYLIETEITNKVKESIEKDMIKKIGKIVDETIKNETLPWNYSSDPRVTIPEHIKNLFIKDGRHWSSPNEQIKKLGEVFANQMKERYDLQFASQLVAKMNENNMLKDDIAKVLLK